MTSLESYLKRNYRDHPNFRTDAQPYHIENDHVEQFSIAYGTLRSYAQDLSRPSIAGLEKKCFEYLSRIFLNFRGQASDEYEALFLDELEADCQRLLREELNGYRFHRRSFKTKSRRSEEAILGFLLQDRKYFFSSISADAVEDILKSGASELERFRSIARDGKTKREQLSINTGPTVKKIVDIVRGEYDASGVSDAVSLYMGRAMAVSGTALELSVAGSSWWKNTLVGLKRDPHTLYAHIDESVHVPKSIVYLSDVTVDNGPTSCYPKIWEDLKLNPLQELIGRVVNFAGNKETSPLNAYYKKTYHQSMASEGFRRHFMRLPEGVRFNSACGWDIDPDSPLEVEFVRREVTMIGPPGTAIVFDGSRLFHRGGLMKSGERIALQLVFGPRRSFLRRAAGKVNRWTRGSLVTT